MDWPAFISTIVGAGVSICTSIAVFGFTSWTDGKKAVAREKKTNAFLAFRGFKKLVQITNYLTNTQLHIVNAFKDAHDNGLGDADPYIKLLPMVSAKEGLEPLSTEEMYFLVEGKLSQVISEIDLIYRRALNIEAVLEQFNKMKSEFQTFMEGKASTIEHVEGTRVAFELIGNDGKFANLKGAAMNNLIGHMVEYLERDCVEAKRISQEFLEAAQAHFGADFPSVKIEWKF